MPNLEDKHILLVEDNQINQMIALEILGSTKAKIDTADDGKQAVKAFESSEEGYYDIIFMDIQMPIMDGYEATRQIRAIDREDIPALPILAFSANAREEDHHKSLDSGMNTHIAKPFEITSLIQTINRYLSK